MPRSPRSTQAASGADWTCDVGTPVELHQPPAQHGRGHELRLRRLPGDQLTKGPASGHWISRKKKLGRVAGDPRRKFAPEISIDQRQRDEQRQPEPRDRVTDGVNAPGRWMLPSARRHSVANATARPEAPPKRGIVPRQRHDPAANGEQQNEGRGGRTDIDERDPPLVGQQDGKPRQQQHRQDRSSNVTPTRQTDPRGRSRRERGRSAARRVRAPAARARRQAQ